MPLTGAPMIPARAALALAGAWMSLAALPPGSVQAQPLSIHSATQSATQVGLYQPLIIRFGLSRTYSNPYDPALVDASFDFTGPSGVTRTIPAFWAAEGPGWMARIVPVEIGPHTARINVTDHTGERSEHLLAFLAVASNAPGFVRVDPRNPRYLRFDNGQPYRPVGQNLCWYGGDSIFTTYLDRMAAAGENWTRYWLVPFVNQGLEWGGGVEASARGLGVYSQNNSRLIDGMVDRARSRGIQVQMCLDSFNGWNRALFDNWHENPYNAANGGMLNRPIDYFSHSDARRLARQLYRYIVARWAYSPNVLCWELWNEVDAVGAGDTYFGDYIPQAVLWHREMAAYIRSIDPYDHLITTSFADGGPRSWYVPFWQAPELDLVQVHHYNVNEPRAHLELIRSVRQFGKPVIMGEGNRAGSLDSNGYSIHLLNWAASLEESGCMPWWWDSHIHPNNLYYRFTPVTRFLQGEDWATQGLSTLAATRLAGPGGLELYGSSGPRNAYLFVRGSGTGISGVRVRLDNVDPGEYRVEYWETAGGTLRSTVMINSGTARPVLDVPTFDHDIAVKVKPAAAVIELSTSHLTASAIHGTSPASSSFTLSNSGTYALNFTLSDDVEWLTLSPVTGSVTTQPMTIQVQWAGQDLPIGQHSGTITVSDPAAINSPQTLAVTLEIMRHPADLDGDGDVDQGDFGILQGCFSGPGYVQEDPACMAARLDSDRDVDQVDLNLLRRCMGAAGQRPPLDCLTP